MAEEKEEKKDQGFVFVDKRKSHDEEPQEPQKAREKAPESKGSAGAAVGSDEGGAEHQKASQEQSMPTIDFNSFILSLSSSAMMNMGVIPNPLTREIEKDLPMAKQTIDLLAMLEKKTQGNRTPEEDKFISAILYDLRMKFVEESKK
ncbi:MAG: DUF1844 domain-containing protein [bacterium]|nr:DUF1844 domain-containing protein [bacterium]